MRALKYYLREPIEQPGEVFNQIRLAHDYDNKLIAGWPAVPMLPEPGPQMLEFIGNHFWVHRSQPQPAQSSLAAFNSSHPK